MSLFEARREAFPWGAALLAVAAGAAQAIAIATPWSGQPLWWLQLLSLALLAGVLHQQASARRAALVGWLFAIAWLAGTWWWLFISMHVYGGLAAPLAVIAVLLLAAALRQLLSPDALARLMGAESGIFGLFIATLVGTLSPGGPMAAFPLVLVLAGAGADRGALVAFILAWSLNGFQKLLVYEAPLLGLDFAMLRTLITFPMPMIAGWIARRVPIAWEPPK